ncbi:hypothetical protein FQA39_LY17799 [Lamprigera yunnana]|nr:hypothetical protein FQA39_LY17799 [Lamprigera yunnana]
MINVIMKRSKNQHTEINQQTPHDEELLDEEFVASYVNETNHESIKSIKDNPIILPDTQPIIDAAIPSTCSYIPTIDEYVPPRLRTQPRISSNISVLNQGKRNKSSAATITPKSFRLLHRPCIMKHKIERAELENLEYTVIHWRRRD